LTLNSVIASIILYRRENKLALAEIIEDSDFLFRYFRTMRAHATNMHAPPTQDLIESHIKGLGFSMENKGKKNCKVLLEPRISELEN